MTVYIGEDFTDEEQDVLRRYFTNLDGPVFALVNLPEVVKGALFARYSRSPKSLRRLFLDEFVGDLDISGDLSVDATMGLERAEQLYQRVFLEYGDDSVAQLGGVHLACEQASNLLTKVLEWGRLAAYLEQSTRYIAYDSRLGGRYRYYRDPEVLASPLGLRYVAEMDAMFDSYAALVPVMQDFFRTQFPKDAADSDFVYRQALKAKALDSIRGMLPAASLSNVGIYATGQAYEMLLYRMRSHPLPESRAYADLMLEELRKVIPSFLRRVDLPDRGEVWRDYLEDREDAMWQIAGRLIGDEVPEEAAEVTLVDWDPDAEIKLVASMLYAYTDLPETQLEVKARAMSVDDRLSVMRAYEGDRKNRRHKPGRALERPSYRFDILADYGAFRDLQRHRLLSLEWQKLTTRHGYDRPPAVDAAGQTAAFDAAVERSAALHDDLRDDFPDQASYAVALAYKVRFYMHLNARAATHMLELRSGPQGHPAYRRIAQEMHRLIADKAGHRAIAESMRFVDHSAEPELERLGAERAAEARRSANLT
ncbi:MAG: FAD-dependent thymidylate synthase [Acidimicrobiales bacterium]|nr:FAD-dependent thymidylate synthase [Acidimicrobiales bacterium]